MADDFGNGPSGGPGTGSGDAGALLERVLGDAARQLGLVGSENMPEGLALVDFVLTAGCCDPDDAPNDLFRSLGLTAVSSRTVRVPRPGGGSGRRQDDRVSLLVACGMEGLAKAGGLIAGLDAQALEQAALLDTARALDPQEKIPPYTDRGAKACEVQLQLMPGRSDSFPLDHFHAWALSRGMEPHQALGMDLDECLWVEPVMCQEGGLEELARYAFVFKVSEVERMRPLW
ncbi:MAG: hypothetical protein LBT40_09685 [Deltaproteobacteria bacterium]|jgi:hypothetical protein|nr:hypothetical protein [Deltaproteobacteria bacterium]